MEKSLRLGEKVTTLLMPPAAWGRRVGTVIKKDHPDYYIEWEAQQGVDSWSCWYNSSELVLIPGLGKVEAPDAKPEVNPIYARITDLSTGTMQHIVAFRMTKGLEDDSFDSLFDILMGGLTHKPYEKFTREEIINEMMDMYMPGDLSDLDRDIEHIFGQNFL